MSEIKKDNAQEAVKQLGQYKVGQFAQLKNFVAEQKSRVAALMATAVVRRDALALKEDEERTKEYEGDILLDVVSASNEIEAVAKVSEEWEIHPDMLYAVQHIVDAFFNADKDKSRPRIEGNSYTGDDDCGFEFLMPDMRTVRIKFQEAGSLGGKYLMSVSVKTS